MKQALIILEQFWEASSKAIFIKFGNGQEWYNKMFGENTKQVSVKYLVKTPNRWRYKHQTSECAIYAHPIEEKVRAEYSRDKGNKYDQKKNITNAVAMTYEILVPIFLKKQFKKAISAFDNIVENTREIVRPNRNVKRKKIPKRTYSMGYKRL